MALPVSTHSPNDGAAADFGPMAGSFAGQARDFPGPVEFSPPSAFPLLEPASQPAPGGLRPGPAFPWVGGIGELASLLSPTPPMVPQETAFSLQELAGALARPLPAPVGLPPAAPEDFSLNSLAEQLNARFSQVGRSNPESTDLLSMDPAPPGAVPPLEPLPGLAGLLPSLGLKPAPPVTPRAAQSRLTNPPKAPPPLRQGDVFFIDPLPNHPPGHAATPPGYPEPTPALLFEPDATEALEALDLMNVPLPVPALLPAPPSRPGAGRGGAGISSASPHKPDSRPPEVSLAQLPAAAGTGLVLGGAGLILLGIFLACQLPAFWLELDGADAWTRQKTEAAMILNAAAALAALILGTGSVSLRRWAPPLIHAAGWVAALTACGIIAVTGFSWVNLESDEALSDGIPWSGLLAAFLLPLGYILYYQRDSVTATSEAADPQPAWTDGLPVPALMVFLTGLSLTVGAAALLCHQPALGLPPEQIITGRPATAAWALLGAIGLGIALCVRRKHPAALWLLLLVVLGLAISVSPSAFAGGDLWRKYLTALGRPAEAGPSAPLVPVLASLMPVLLLLIFAMARRAFPSPPPP